MAKVLVLPYLFQLKCYITMRDVLTQTLLNVWQVVYGNSPELEELLGCPGPFWGRKYFFWTGGKPLTLIHEVFSNRLQQVLGPLPDIIHIPAGQ
jgi:chorismate lyase